MWVVIHRFVAILEAVVSTLNVCDVHVIIVESLLNIPAEFAFLLDLQVSSFLMSITILDPILFLKPIRHYVKN